MRQRGEITHWIESRGFGFITPNSGGKDVFVHISSFEPRPESPPGNEKVSFRIGKDSRGRPSAVDVRLIERRAAISGLVRHGNFRLAASILFFVFLAISTLAGRLPVMVIGVYLAASLASLGIYAWDKSAARNDRQRMPEKTLHTLDLVGGWPGALAAQQLFRHKSRKRSFQVVFWVTVIANCTVLFFLFTGEGHEFLRALLESSSLLA